MRQAVASRDPDLAVAASAHAAKVSRELSHTVKGWCHMCAGCGADAPARALAGRAQALPSRASGSLVSRQFSLPPARACIELANEMLRPCARGSRLAGSQHMLSHRRRDICIPHRKCARQVAKLTQLLQSRSSKGQGPDAAGSLGPGAAAAAEAAGAAAETVDAGVQTEGVLLLPTVCECKRGCVCLRVCVCVRFIGARS